MQYKALLFDMDGTLMDSEHLHIKAWIKVLFEIGIDVDHQYFDKWIGINDMEMMKRILHEYNVIGKDSDSLVEEKRAHFREFAKTELRTLPGVTEGLLKLAHIPMALVTMSNRKDALMSISSTGVDHHFKVVVTLNDVNHAKPHPEPFTKAANLLGYIPEDCIAIEDSVSGVKSAKSAGCFVVAVANTIDAMQLVEADIVLKDSMEMMGWLKERI